MILKLMWKDKNDNAYHIGNLTKKEETYIFEIKENNLKHAIKQGCMGIGEFDLLKNYYTSKELFEFFKQRIPDKNHPHIDKILKKYELKKYNEMLLLEKTKGLLMTDRYFIEKD